MIKQCCITNSGILFDKGSIAEIGIHPDTFELLPGPASGIPSAPTSTSLETYAIAKIVDQLVAKPMWWVLEVIPLMHSYYHRGQRRRYIA
jgi:hypothetical protein